VKEKAFPYPTAIPGIKQVDKMNILGITISDTLTFHHHISDLIAKSARSFCALKTIHTRGLNGNALWDVTHAALVLQFLYASPAWWGYLKADEMNRLQSVIKKAKWYSYAFVMSVKVPVLTYLQHFCQNLLKLLNWLICVKVIASLRCAVFGVQKASFLIKLYMMY